MPVHDGRTSTVAFTPRKGHFRARDATRDNGRVAPHRSPRHLLRYTVEAPALALYRKMGFSDAAPPVEMTLLARTQAIMAKALARPGA